MRHLSRYLTISLLFLIGSHPAFADSLSLTTYYPAPFGSYNILRLVPISDASAGTCDASKSGQFYLSSNTNDIKVCNGTTWGPLGGVWTLNAATKEAYLTSSPTDTAYKVGIGIASPNARLHVKGNDNANYGQMEIESLGNDAKLSLMNASGATTLGSGSLMMSNTGGSEGMRFMINNVDKMILDENGRLGVGLTAPNTVMHVKGPDNASFGQLDVESSQDNARISLYNADNATTKGHGDIVMSRTANSEGLRFMINGNDKVIIDENGNMGIGLTAPTAMLDVERPVGAIGTVSTAKFDNIQMIDENNANYTSNALCNGANCLAGNNDFLGVRLLANTAANTNNLTLGVPTTGLAASDITLNVGNTSVLTVNSQSVVTDNSVNVGIGVAAPAYKLQVNGPIGGSLDSAAPGAVGELQVNCTTVPGKCYAVYAP